MHVALEEYGCYIVQGTTCQDCVHWHDSACSFAHPYYHRLKIGHTPATTPACGRFMGGSLPWPELSAIARPADLAIPGNRRTYADVAVVPIARMQLLQMNGRINHGS